MVHMHALSHPRLARRQRQRQQEDDDDDNEVVVIVTAKNTFTESVVWVTAGAEQTLPEPAIRTESRKLTPTAHPTKSAERTSSKETEPEETDKPFSSSSSSASASASEKSSSSAPSATASPSNLLSQTGLATVASSTTAALASISSTSSPSSSAEAAESSGMSGGAKAGLVLGILVAIAALLGAALFFVHRKKKNAQASKVDDEKFAMQNAPPPPAPQVTTMPAFAEPPQPTSPSAAPQLSLRPVTEFDPALPNGAVAAVPAAGAKTRSAWERPGASNASTAAANPFSDPQPPQMSSSPPQNPFDNSAALPTSPTSPTAANPAAALAAVAAAAPAAKSATENKEPPLSPASTAWTDDIPASPGPAPSGPLPIANPRGANGPAPAANNVHRVQLDFKPSMGDELELRAGQLVRMLHEYDDGWALCVRMDRSHQGVVPRTCLSKLPVKPRTGSNSPRQQQPGTPRMRGPPPVGAQPRPLSPASGPRGPNGRNSPQPSPAHGRMSPGPNRQGPPPQGRNRSHSNAPYAGQPRSMSPGPYGGGPQQMAPPPQMGRPRANSAGGASRRGPQPGGPGPSPMNPNNNNANNAHVNGNANAPMPSRKPLPGQAM